MDSCMSCLFSVEVLYGLTLVSSFFLNIYRGVNQFSLYLFVCLVLFAYLKLLCFVTLSITWFL
jgi:hypothetical protein